MPQRNSLLIGTLLLLLAVAPCAAQQSLTLTLEAAPTLSDLIKEALRANPEIVAARKAVEAAQARIIPARSLDDPELNLESWAIPIDQPTNLNQANMHMVNLRQRFLFPGKLRLRGEVASQEEAMAGARYQAKEREVIAAVKKGYYELFMADRNIQITTEQLELHERVLRTTETRYTVGKTSQSDVVRAQVEHSDLINRLIVAEQERESAEARLNALLNRPTDALIGKTAELEPSSTTPFEQNEL